MEPERKIEKLLRAYARKRRAGAGDPLQLHPATRRLLQGEVARRTPRLDEEDSSVSLWELFRQQWAFLAAFVLIIFLGATLLLPGLGAAKQKAKSVAAMSQLKEIGLAVQLAAADNNGKLPASLDALTNEYLKSTTLTDPQSGKPFAYIRGGGNLNYLSSNALMVYSPEDKNGRAVLFADGRVEYLNRDKFSEFTNHNPGLVAFARSARSELGESAADSPAAAGLISQEKDKNPLKKGDNNLIAINGAVTSHTMDIGMQTNAASLAINSPQVLPAAGSANLPNLFKNNIASAKAAPVLANFQVQQNGNAVRIVDADGSVYDGSLQPESVVAQNGPVQASTPASPGDTLTLTHEEKIIANRDESKIQSQTAQNYSFRVTGINRTLKQNVVFVGNLLANSNATTNLQQIFSGSIGGGQMQSAITNQLPWSNSRIAGTAVIADTNSIEINAMPLSP